MFDFDLKLTIWRNWNLKKMSPKIGHVILKIFENFEFYDLNGKTQ